MTLLGRRRGRRRRRTSSIVIAAAAIGIEAIVMRLRGYSIGLNVPVRCRAGHLFTTIWIPGASLKSIRLGLWRFQYCPVGKHWSVVSPVSEVDLSLEEKRTARDNRDIRIP